MNVNTDSSIRWKCFREEKLYFIWKSCAKYELSCYGWDTCICMHVLKFRKSRVLLWILLSVYPDSYPYMGIIVSNFWTIHPWFFFFFLAHGSRGSVKAIQVGKWIGVEDITWELTATWLITNNINLYPTTLFVQGFVERVYTSLLSIFTFLKFHYNHQSLIPSVWGWLEGLLSKAPPNIRPKTYPYKDNSDGLSPSNRVLVVDLSCG